MYEFALIYKDYLKRKLVLDNRGEADSILIKEKKLKTNDKSIEKRRGLGKGLNALIPSMEDEDVIIHEPNNNGLYTIDIDKIDSNKNQPRKFFNDDKIAELAQSISEHGVVQPIVVTKVISDSVEQRYMIIAGERRWRASKVAGLKQVPAIIKDYSEKTIMEVALIENLQREDLNPIEEALAFRALIDDYKMTQDEIAKRIGKSRSAVANTLRLLNLPELVREMLITGKITAGHGRAILSLEGEQNQIDAAQRASSDGLNVREAEALKRDNINKKMSNQNKIAVIKDHQIITIEDDLMKNLGTKVKIHYKKGSGKIEISFTSDDDLNRLIELFN